MADADWEILKQIFHAAVALPANERAAFIAQSARGDDSLRQSIESLLKSHDETDSFLDEPAYQAAAEMLIDSARLKDGQLVAHYKIVSLLGEGGMGRVYLAEDTKLHRRVCLKFISRRFTSNPEWLQRFELEARAASVLNHPNILTIHEIGEAEGHPFIATEFIAGQTLRERLDTDISIDEALETAIQIASALVAAHRVNVVHRDIKPENIMIRDDDGLVKVLDFGLAKVAGRESRNFAAHEDHEDETQSLFETSAGAVMGTVAYMSPEQARGDIVDARTDVWSLGVILYEMISSASPFVGATSDEVISAILQKSPLPLKHHVEKAPKGLADIVSRALARNREQRYQTSQDLLADLKEFQQTLRLEAINQSGSKPASALTARQTAGSAIVGRTTKTSFSARSLTHQVTAHKRGAIAIASLVFFSIVTGLAVYGWRLKHTTAATVAGPSQIRSLAVLPLRSLDSGDDVLGVGIADAVIRKISQTGKISVRPTSAVLRFSKGETDSLAAARQLSADAILEGTVQRAGDRFRVTVNLLRSSDGLSIYADSFDVAAADVFAIQDKVAQQVSSRLQVSLGAVRPAHYPTDARAYEAYIRGLVSLDERGYEIDALPQMTETINFFKRAIEIDPKYALPHAKLAFAYAWTGVAIEQANSQWAELAREEIKEAQALDPNLAETHVAHAYMLWTAYEGYQSEAAIQELRLAKQLDPNLSTPDLPAILGHLGLDDLASRELQRAQEIDPTSQSLKDLKMILLYIQADADGWLAERQKYPSGFKFLDPWYYVRKGLLADGEKAINERLVKMPGRLDFLMQQALLFALKGENHAAESRASQILSKVQMNDQSRHHKTYYAACIYALGGNSGEAVKWLKETAATGFPNYPLFARDPFLDRIRKAPEFVQFMSEQKSQWERYRQEFAD
jgi:serine/threonine protein kinase/TolB-like protein